MTETPFYFPNGHYQLFGILHRPEKDSKNLGFVFVHPFAEEKLWTQRVLVNFARELAKHGYPVLRFDFMGHGDSEGNFEESSIETRLSDIDCAIDKIEVDIPDLKKIGLLGLRFGATLAVLAAERSKRVQKLILWDPIIDGEKYMHELLRINLTTQTAVHKKIIYDREKLIEKIKVGETVNIDGYELSYNLFNQASDIKLESSVVIFSGECLIVQISRGSEKIRKDLENLSKKYQRIELINSQEYPFWKEIKIFYSKAPNLYKDNLTWLEKHND